MGYSSHGGGGLLVTPPLITAALVDKDTLLHLAVRADSHGAQLTSSAPQSLGSKRCPCIEIMLSLWRCRS